MLKKKLFVIANFSSGGGTEKLAAILLNRLLQCFRIKLLLAENKSPFFRSLDKNSFQTHFLVHKKCRGSFYRNAFKIWLRLLFFRPSGLLVFNYQLGLAAALALNFLPHCMQPKRRVLAHHISIKAVNSETEVARMKKYFHLFSHHIVPSSTLISEFLHIIPNMDIEVIPNGLDINEVLQKASATTHYTDAGKKWNCVYVGGLRVDKRVDKLLYYFSQLPEKNDVSLTIVGDGDEREALKELAAKLGISSECNFIGYVENPYPYIAHADLLVQTTDWETFGLTILEAMVLKTPVLATQGYSHGLEEVIQDRVNGRLVDHADEPLFIQAWSELLHSEEQRKLLAMQAFESIQKYSEESMVEKYIDVVNCV